MALKVNDVYTTVLSILNKEQRGYLPPSEFNSLAELVQNEIFNSYFPDGNQLNRQNQNNIQNDTEFFNIYENNRYKLYPFEHEVSFNYDTTYNCWSFSPQLSTDYGGTIRLLGSILAKYNKPGSTTDSIVQLTSKGDYNKITRSKLTSPTSSNPIYYIQKGTSTSPYLFINPEPQSVAVNCIVYPLNPSWGFTVGSLNQYIYNSGTSIDFELDLSEQTNIIMKILKYCGVIVNDPNVINVASQEIQKTEINEKS